MGNKKLFSTKNVVFSVLIAVLISLAIMEQLRLSPKDRTWYGSIAGIPYDFRVPSLKRLQSTVWNKDNPSLLAPKFFGMGWDINFYRLLHPGEK